MQKTSSPSTWHSYNGKRYITFLQKVMHCPPEYCPLVPPVHANNRVWIPPQTRVFCKKSIGQGTKLAISSAEEEIIHLPLRPQKRCSNECEDAARHPRFLCHNHLFLLPQNPCSKSRVPKMCPNSCFSPKNARRKGFVEISTKPYFSMAERVGFEPTVAHHHT